MSRNVPEELVGMFDQIEYWSRIAAELIKQECLTRDDIMKMAGVPVIIPYKGEVAGGVSQGSVQGSATRFCVRLNHNKEVIDTETSPHTYPTPYVSGLPAVEKLNQLMQRRKV